MTDDNIRCWHTISWQDGVPYSNEFGDVYFSRKGGPEETETVFLGANHYRDRISQPARCVVGELGFGTGLNFLICWKALREHGHPDASLRFISCDRYPLSREAISEALSLYPTLENYAAELLEQYPTDPFGSHRLHFENGRVRLDLVLEEASVMLNQLRAEVDAWFLDGFTPSRNPAMWKDNILLRMAALSGKATTVGTFSAAGHVKRGLESAGFAMARYEGAGNKRHNMRGQFQGRVGANMDDPWYSIPKDRPLPRRAAVIGAGLAGTSAARALALRGTQVFLLDQHPQPARGTSGNPWGLIMPMLTRKPAPQGELALAAMQGLLRRLKNEDPTGLMHACGVIEINDTVSMSDCAGIHRLDRLPESFVQALDPSTLAATAGIPAGQKGIYYPQAGCVSPRVFCERQAATPGIELKMNWPAAHIEKQGDCWNVHGRNGEVLEDMDTVVFAQAHDVCSFKQISWLPLRLIRGQLSTVPEGSVSRRIQTALVHGGYITPPIDQQHVIGATYTVHDDSLAWAPEDHARVINDCVTALPALKPETKNWLAASKGRAGIRCMTPDQLPAAGPVPDKAGYEEDYGDLHYGRYWQDYPAGRMHPGLWMTIGHGSRGIMTSQFCAELLVDQMFNEPIVHGPLAQRLHPARYLIRELKRGPAENKA